MRNAITLFCKEIRHYFFSITAYLIAFIFLLIVGYFFSSALSYFSLLSFQIAAEPDLSQGTWNLTETVLGNLFLNISIVLILMVPILTMRLFSEEFKRGTYELLLTYPVKEWEIVTGKFLACLTVIVFMVLPTAIYSIVVWSLGASFEKEVLFTGYLGVFFLAMSFVAFGIFASSLNENQILSACLCFGALLFLWIIGWMAQFLPTPIAVFINHLSLVDHLTDFTRGIIDSHHIAYYLFFTLFFLVATSWRLEARRA